MCKFIDIKNDIATIFGSGYGEYAATSAIFYESGGGYGWFLINDPEGLDGSGTGLGIGEGRYNP